MTAEAREWQEHSLTLKQVLALETSPVAVSCVKGPSPSQAGRARMCRAILEASTGKELCISRETNDCFGGAWHLGLWKPKNPRAVDVIRKFVVEGEKLFSSYEALDLLMSRMEEVPDNSNSYFALAPLEEADFAPQLVVFVVDAEGASRLLTLVTFDGAMPNIKIGGPTCRMAVTYPLLTGEVNVSFYDYAARKMCRVEKDKLLVSVPYDRITRIVESMDECSAGRAKIEYPKEVKRLFRRRRTRGKKGA